MMRRGMGLGVALASALAGCGGSEIPGTQVLVEVEAEPAVAAQLTLLRAFWYVADQRDETKVAGELPLRLPPPAPDQGETVPRLLGSFGIAKGHDPQFKLVVKGYASAAQGAPALIEQKALITFQEDRKVTVRLSLWRACWERAAECTALDRTCFPSAGGGCVGLTELVPSEPMPPSTATGSVTVDEDPFTAPSARADGDASARAPGDVGSAPIPSSDAGAAPLGVADAAVAAPPAASPTPMSASPAPATPPPGTPNPAPTGTPTPVPPVPAPQAPTVAAPRGASTVATGSFHACAIRADATVACWGFNGFGNLGDGTTQNASTPVSVVGLTDVVELAAGPGGNHTCARRGDGTVMCWGLSACGQLGSGTPNRCGPGAPNDTWSTVPVPVLGLTDAVDIAAGAYGSCARRGSGAVVCWGSIGADAYAPVPVTVAGLEDAVELTVGSGQACARTRRGTMVCWGVNENGRLGDGTTVDRATPVAALGLSDLVQISAGKYHSCALRRDGVVLGAGQDAAVGSAANVLVPLALPGFTNVTHLASTDIGTCAVRADGSTLCVGRPPIAAITLPGDVIELAGGGAHLCARRANRSVLCWGDDQYGQLGVRRGLLDGLLGGGSDPREVPLEARGLGQ